MTTIISQSFLFHLIFVHELTVLCTRTLNFSPIPHCNRIARMIARPARSAWVWGVVVPGLTGAKETAAGIAGYWSVWAYDLKARALR